MDSLYADLLHWLQTHGMLGIFLFMVFENLAIPFPSWLGFLAAQALIDAGYTSYLSVFLVITAGHLCGAALTYYPGRAGHGFLARRFSLSKGLTHARAVLQKWYVRYGVLAILIGRLLGHVRPWASLVAGMAHVPPLRFWIWTVTGSLLYTAAAMWFTVWGWHLWVQYPRLRLAGLIAMAAISYGVSAYAGIRGLIRRRRRLLLARAAAEEAEYGGE